MSHGNPVIISGAGISGLALAQGLLKARIPFRIYERDSAIGIRSQGYRVRINGDGIEALKEVLPKYIFHRLQGSCAHVSSKGPAPAYRLDALTGEEMEKLNIPLPKDDLEPLNADREVLRRVLMTSLEDYVVFGKDVTSFESEPGGVRVMFSDGTEVKGSLLVGADGAGSKIRKQILSEGRLIDTEGRFIYGKTTLTPQLEKLLHQQTLKGLTLVQDRSGEIPLSLLVEPIRFKDNEYREELPANYMYWVLIGRKDFTGLSDSNLSSLTSRKAAALAQTLTAHWHSSFQALFTLQQATKTSCLKIGSMVPQIPSWDEAGLVTLIGDSAHAMSPTAVVGAVTALRDSAMLTRLLIEVGVNVEGLRRYEAAMREYAGNAIVASQMGGRMMFAMRPFKELKPQDI